MTARTLDPTSRGWTLRHQWEFFSHRARHGLDLDLLARLQALTARGQLFGDEHVHELIGKPWRCVELAEMADPPGAVSRLFF